MPQIWAQLQTSESGGDQQNRTYNSRNQYYHSFCMKYVFHKYLTQNSHLPVFWFSRISWTPGLKATN